MRPIRPSRHRLARFLTSLSAVVALTVVVFPRPASALPCIEVTNDYPFVYVKVCPPV